MEKGSSFWQVSDVLLDHSESIRKSTGTDSTGADWDQKSAQAFLTQQPIFFLEAPIISQIMIILRKNLKLDRPAHWATNGPAHLVFEIPVGQSAPGPPYTMTRNNASKFAVPGKNAIKIKSSLIMNNLLITNENVAMTHPSPVDESQGSATLHNSPMSLINPCQYSISFHC